MTTELVTQEPKATMLERVVVGNDLSKLAPAERLTYYAQICQSLGLNPLTQPFQYLFLNGKLTLYATKAATDQLRELKGVSITRVETQKLEDLYVVTAHATRGGRTDSSMGAVSIAGLKGDALANAMMKAETKAKRRATLSICGLGLLDESEVGPGFRVDDPGSITGVSDGIPVTVDPATGELADPEPEPAIADLDEADQRAILIGRIHAGEDKLQLSAAKRAELWAKYCGGATPETVDVAALDDLLKALRALYKAVTG